MRILVIEDDEAVAEGLAVTLRAEGFDVDNVFDGRSGLDAALAGPYDIVVLDVMLPGMNGYRVCQAMRDADVALNGTELVAAADGNLPDLDAERAAGAIEVPPASVAFIVDPRADIAACA